MIDVVVSISRALECNLDILRRVRYSVCSGDYAYNQSGICNIRAILENKRATALSVSCNSM